MRSKLAEFRTVHARRPIADNLGGMRAPHLFATWFMVRALRPTHIVESGVFKGLGTWLLEQAAPTARLFCIEPNPAAIEYRSAHAEYFTRDFAETAWDLPRATTLIFFDDHQNAFERVRLARKLGFCHLIFEDNYPLGRGDCYSLKRALMGEPPPAPRTLLDRARRSFERIGNRDQDAVAFLEQALETYCEFPPVMKSATTRWGDAWDDERYPTPEPLLTRAESEAEAVFENDADSYTWICYARIRRQP
ncbi:MAG TPA: hypothetical protein VF103_01490 [Polyangiaceae bacterium]